MDEEHMNRGYGDDDLLDEGAPFGEARGAPRKTS